MRTRGGVIVEFHFFRLFKAPYLYKSAPAGYETRAIRAIHPKTYLISKYKPKLFFFGILIPGGTKGFTLFSETKARN